MRWVGDWGVAGAGGTDDEDVEGLFAVHERCRCSGGLVLSFFHRRAEGGCHVHLAGEG